MKAALALPFRQCPLAHCLDCLERLLDRKRRLQHLLSMTAHIYGRGQMVIPAKARKEARIGRGDVVLVEPEGDGRILLTRLERAKSPEPSKARLVRRKGKHPVIVGGPRITTEQIRRILSDEFP